VNFRQNRKIDPPRVPRVRPSEGPEGLTLRGSRGFDPPRVPRVRPSEGPKGSTLRGSRGFGGSRGFDPPRVPRVRPSEGPEGSTLRGSRGFDPPRVNFSKNSMLTQQLISPKRHQISHRSKQDKLPNGIFPRSHFFPYNSHG